MFQPAPNQSGFKPGDSCINQLLSVTHEIYLSFDNEFEVRYVFLDLSSHIKNSVVIQKLYDLITSYII